MFSLDRKPDFIVGDKDNPYLKRWFRIPRNPVFNVYHHLFLRSDDDRALHDHMYVNLSVLLKGRYIEHTIRAGGVHVQKLRIAGTWSGIKFRLPWTAHRIELVDGTSCETLFITGPRVRRWGFHCPKGWRHWKEFVTSGPDGNKAGKGCGD